MGLLSFAEDTKPSHVDDKMKWKESSALAEPSKPQQKEKVKQKQSKLDDGLYSLSFDQVNDNADELIELRGEGRYFGVTDPDTGATINAQQSLGPLCDNCHKRGHIRSKCKTVVCHKCGVVGDHYETQCPTTMICSRCGERGHLFSACKSKTRKKQYCKTCDTFNHGDFNCPSIWRSYITKVAKDEEYVLPVIFCYNCGDNTHFGDECPQQRSSRVPNFNGSAFSGTNLPKHLRSVYFDSLNRGTSRPNGPKKRNYEDSGNLRNYNLGYSLGYNSNLNYNSNYNSNYNNFNSNGSNNNYRNYNSNNNNNSTVNSYNNAQPSRSGFIASNTNKKKSQLPPRPSQASRTGYLPKKGAKPNRSGVMKGKKRNGNIQVLY